ncbi:MAG TPA: thiamine pyrophosphate-dependent enzyme [Candidatus Binatia bacterium]|jgi:sulfopyruvate decarboxylase subunit beta
MTHFEAVQTIGQRLTNEIVVVSVGYTNLELHSVNDRKLNLYAIQMSLATPVAFGLAKAIPGRKVVSFDGDGSMLMGLGILSTIATHPVDNLLIVLLDNGCYAACGWYSTSSGRGSDLAGIASAAGIPNVRTVETTRDLASAYDELLAKNGPGFIRAKVESGPQTQVLDQLPLDRLESTYRFRQALTEEGLVGQWREARLDHYTSPR